MNNIVVTCKKELRGIFRDKKFLAIIFLMPFIIPAFIIFMGFLYDGMSSGDYAVGLDYSLNEVEKEIINNISKNTEYIENKSVDELKSMYEEGSITAYVLKEDNNYYIYTDTSTEDGMMVTEVIGNYLDSYNNYLGNIYLVNNNINPDDVFNIVKIEVKDLAKEGTDYFSNFLINFALSYLVMIIVITAMNTTTDIIAGEKERGTFETLLTFPIKSTEIIAGKFLAIVISCILTSLVGICISIPAFIFVKNSLEMFSSMEFHISIITIVLSIIILILTSCLSAGVCIALTGRAKTFKEAQSKQSIVTFFSMIPLFSGYMNITSIVLYLIPIANCGTILNDIFLKEMDIKNLLIVIISTIIYTVGIIMFVSKQYKKEDALF
jgi:sodium transport system permease protein